MECEEAQKGCDVNFLVSQKIETDIAGSKSTGEIDTLVKRDLAPCLLWRKRPEETVLI